MALLGAVREFRRGNSQNMNRYLRGRVVAQGATVAAMLIGSYVYETRSIESKEQEKQAERERMMDIFNNLTDPDAPPPPPPPPAPLTPEQASRPVHRYELINVVKSSKDESELPQRKTRYIGDNDQWREFFNRKPGGGGSGEGGGTASGPPSDGAAGTKW